MTNQQPVVLITGGSMGLGFALAQTLLNRGFRISICARNRDFLEAQAEVLKSFGPVFHLAGDVGDPQFAQQFVTQTVKTFGRLDGIVNNASVLGDLPLPPLLETTVANLNAVFRVNTFAPVTLFQAAWPFLSQQKRSLALSISSDAALAGYPTWGVYGASKAALDLIHRTLAAEHEESGLTVFAVDPSDMATVMHEQAIPGDTGLKDPNDVASALWPIFRPLVESTASFPYVSGARLAVQGDQLLQKEGR